MAFRDAASSVTTSAQGLVEALAEVLRHEAVHEWVNAAETDTPIIVAVKQTLLSCVRVLLVMRLPFTHY
jgi:hypothetical protein